MVTMLMLIVVSSSDPVKPKTKQIGTIYLLLLG